jgi:hypothetical protein
MGCINKYECWIKKKQSLCILKYHPHISWKKWENDHKPQNKPFCYRYLISKPPNYEAEVINNRDFHVHSDYIRFEVIMVASVKITVFWIGANILTFWRETSCLFLWHSAAVKMEAEGSSERRHILEDDILHIVINFFFFFFFLKQRDALYVMIRS